jgi:hypothetical protein
MLEIFAERAVAGAYFKERKYSVKEGDDLYRPEDPPERRLVFDAGRGRYITGLPMAFLARRALRTTPRSVQERKERTHLWWRFNHE